VKDVTINEKANVVKGSYRIDVNTTTAGDSEDGVDDDSLPAMTPNWGGSCKIAGKIVKDKKNFLYLEVARKGGDGTTFFDVLKKVQERMDQNADGTEEEEEVPVGEEVVDDMI